jgi:hypothetical protein
MQFDTVSVVPTGMSEDVEKDTVMFKDVAPASSFQVFLDDTEDPQNMSPFRKWAIIFIVSWGGMCATCSSSIVRLHASLRSFIAHFSFLAAEFHQCAGHGQIWHFADRCNTCGQPIRRGLGNRASVRWTVVGSIWKECSVPDFIRSSVRILVARGIRAQCW